MGARFKVNLIGPFGFFNSHGRRIEITSKRGVALIALLAMSPEGVRTRVWLQTMLWESRGFVQAQASLRREISTLATLFAQNDASDLLSREHGRIAINHGLLDIDALSLAAGLSTRTSRIDGEFLEGIDLPDCEGFEEWLREQRARCRDLLDYVVPEPTTLMTAQQVLGAPLPPTMDLLEAKPLGIPAKPSVAVLPFATRGCDEPDGILGAGIAEEIELTLANFRTLFVVSGISARAVAARPLTSSEMAARLGVRYLITGSVERIGDQLKVAVVLLEGGSGHRLWSHVSNGTMDNLFALQAEIARSVAPRLHSQIDSREIENGLTRQARSGDAYQLYWRANALFRQWDRESMLEAIGLCEQLVEIEPANPWPSAMAAFCYASAYRSNWAPDREAARRAAMLNYQNAMRYGGNDPTVLGYAAGTLISIGGDVAVADRLIAHALNLFPAYQPTLFWGGWVDIAMGNAARALDRFELSLRINPEAGARAYAITGIGIALLMQGQVADAHAMLTEAVQYVPSYPMTLAALSVTSIILGHQEDARSMAITLRASGGLEQVLAVLQNPAHRALLSAGLSQAEDDSRSGQDPPNA